MDKALIKMIYIMIFKYIYQTLLWAFFQVSFSKIKWITKFCSFGWILDIYGQWLLITFFI